jgi:hypothetical protein
LTHKDESQWGLELASLSQPERTLNVIVVRTILYTGFSCEFHQLTNGEPQLEMTHHCAGHSWGYDSHRMISAEIGKNASQVVINYKYM